MLLCLFYLQEVVVPDFLNRYSLSYLLILTWLVS